MSERVFAISGDWAIGADGLQWILYRRHKKGTDKWAPISFIASEHRILERCMREKGCPRADAVALLDGLPNTFDDWKRTNRAPIGEYATAK